MPVNRLPQEGGMPIGGNWPGSNRTIRSARKAGLHPVYCRPISFVARCASLVRIKRLAARHAVSDRTSRTLPSCALRAAGPAFRGG